MRKNTGYYLGLSLFSVLMFIVIIRKANPRVKRFLLPLFLAYTGLNYLFDYFIFVIGNAYRYSPKILKNSYFDNILGSSVSQLFFVPTTGLFLSVFNLKYKWSLLFSILITYIEKLFIKKKAFKNYWWSIYYTTIGLQLFYKISKYWKVQLIERQNKLIMVLTLFFSIFVSSSTMIFYHVSLLKTFLFEMKWFKNRYRSHVAIATIYTSFCSLIVVCCILLKKSYLSMIILCGLDLFLIKIRRLKVSKSLFYLVSPLTKLFNIWLGQYIYRSLFVDNSEKMKVLK